MPFSRQRRMITHKSHPSAVQQKTIIGKPKDSAYYGIPVIRSLSKSDGSKNRKPKYDKK